MGISFKVVLNIKFQIFNVFKSGKKIKTRAVVVITLGYIKFLSFTIKTYLSILANYNCSHYNAKVNMYEDKTISSTLIHKIISLKSISSAKN